MTGTTSTRPAKAPTRIQYGSPTAQKSSESAVATARIRSTCPRTNAPRRRSISVQVSRTFLRLGRGISEHTTSTALSRSKIQYAAAANVKKMPITTSNAFMPIPTAGFTSSDRFGRLARRFLSAVKTWCFTPVECLAARATSALPLGLRAWSTWCSAAGTAKASATAMAPTSAR